MSTAPSFRWFAVPDPVLARAGAAGERLLARVRLWLFGALALIPLSWALPSVARGMEAWEVRAGVLDCAGALLAAVLIYVGARREVLPPWFGGASGVLDVSLVSVALAGFLVAGHPFAALNSVITFDLYFLVLAASGLRYDWRVCVLAAAAAVVEYGGLAVWAATHYALTDAEGIASGYGVFSWSLVIARSILLALAGVLAATVVWRAGRLRIASVRDQLTGLTNRAYFDERLAEEWARATRHGGELAALLIDVDHFKRVNDRYGHGGGDEVLQAVARVLRVHAREADVLARYGGEEFALLIVGAERGVGEARGEALRAAVEGIGVALPGVDEAVRVTVSVGVAHAGEEGVGSIVALMHEADGRLYEAKGRGRNGVVGAGASSAALQLGRSTRGEMLGVS